MTDTFIYPNHGPYTALAQSIKGGPLGVRKVMGGGEGSFCRNFFHPIIIFFNHMTLHDFFYYPTPPLTTFLMVRQARHARSRFSVRILIKIFLLFFFILFFLALVPFTPFVLFVPFPFFSNQSSFSFLNFLFFIFTFSVLSSILTLSGPGGRGEGGRKVFALI